MPLPSLLESKSKALFCPLPPTPLPSQFKTPFVLPYSPSSQSTISSYAFSQINSTWSPTLFSLPLSLSLSSHCHGSETLTPHLHPPPLSKRNKDPKMNDLFSTQSFKRYTDLKEQVRLDDVETGNGGGAPETVNLQKFFEDVENVKDDLKGLEQLYKQLQELNEETKLAHNAKTMKELRSRMDGDIERVLRKAKVVKGKLEALDRSNAASRKIPGCGPGSSADRTRTSVVGGIGKKMKDLMDGFQGLRARIAAEYKETVGRRYFTVTGRQADDDTVEAMISSGESEDFLQRAIQEQGRGQVMDAIAEIQERHDAVKEIERSLMDLHQVFLDMAALVDAQGEQLNDIESHVAHASSFVRKGAVELETAKEYQKSSRKWACIAVLLVIVLIAAIVLPLLINLGIIHF